MWTQRIFVLCIFIYVSNATAPNRDYVKNHRRFPIHDSDADVIQVIHKSLNGAKNERVISKPHPFYIYHTISETTVTNDSPRYKPPMVPGFLDDTTPTPLKNRSVLFIPSEVQQGSSRQQAEHLKISKILPSGERIFANLFRTSNLADVSVLPPLPGCGNGLSKTSVTAYGRCYSAINAGFFNVTTGDCLGNVVSDGVLVQTDSRMTANFGVTRSGALFVGYITPQEVITAPDPFRQLIAGLVWIIKDGKKNWEQAMEIEDQSFQTNGPEFATLLSARASVGWDSEGNIIIITVDGRSNHYGINLDDLSDILLEVGVVEAINLDGGGSVAAVKSNELTNFPSDPCNVHPFPELTICERPVTTVMCFKNTKL